MVIFRMFHVHSVHVETTVRIVNDSHSARILPAWAINFGFKKWFREWHPVPLSHDMSGESDESGEQPLALQVLRRTDLIGRFGFRMSNLTSIRRWCSTRS